MAFVVPLVFLVVEGGVVVDGEVTQLRVVPDETVELLFEEPVALLFVELLLF